jgi:hypothetical protein
MQVFNAPAKAVLNCSCFNEAILILMNNLKNDRLKSISHQFGH